jgi:hypothetical protein
VDTHQRGGIDQIAILTCTDKLKDISFFTSNVMRAWAPMSGRTEQSAAVDASDS